MGTVNTVELVIFLALFLLVTVMGFMAARWRRAEALDNLDEWGLGGRGFGTFVSWFLLGGDLYTAYTFIAVPATLYAGSVIGFFAVPYTIVLYPIIFIFLPRFWSVSHRHGYVTPADFVRGRFGSKTLALAVALTGLLATMPYIALQLVGIQVVLEVMGIGGGDSWVARDAPLFIAFAVLAAYTYASGLRAPALIAFVKDTLIYIVILVAVFYLPTQLGGWDHIFAVASKSFASFNSDNADAIAAGSASAKGTIPPGAAQWAYASLALGSALALFMYPHSLTGVLASKNRSVIRRNASLLPAYSFLLGLLALLGFAAIAAGISVTNAQQSVPALFAKMFPSWFAGVAFAAIAIGALVPAAIMSIAAANLWTRNVYKEFIRPDATPAQEARQSKLVSLVVKFGALAFVIWLPTELAINFQLLGGVWILQTFPALVFALYTRWFHRLLVIAWCWV
jgi:SSS family solute:Na+ symporter